MKNKFLTTFLMMVVLSVSAACHAGEYYINEENFSPEFLTPPYKANTPEWEAEVTQMIKNQSAAIKEDLTEAEKENRLSLDSIIPVMGENISPDNHPKTFALLEKTKETCDVAVDKSKNYWKTERPFRASKKVKGLITPPFSRYSYPSGHTACSRLWAEVLGQLVPEKRQLLRDKAKKSAYYRVIGGMHWPIDLVGGEQLALILFGGMQQSAEYQADLKAARAEWQ